MTKHSNISDVTSTPKSVTTNVDQTLTCKIGGLDSGYPVTITWKDPDNREISDTDTINYGLYPGTVQMDGNQEAILIIKHARISSFSDKKSFTHKCAVKSSQYPNSPASNETDVVVNVLVTSGKLITGCGSNF